MGMLKHQGERASRKGSWSESALMRENIHIYKLKWFNLGLLLWYRVNGPHNQSPSAELSDCSVAVEAGR